MEWVYYWITTSFRFANLFCLAEKGDIWSAVKIIRSETLTSQFTCGSNHLLNNQLSRVAATEQLLGIESSELKFQNMSERNLKIAAQVFIYLNACPREYNSWIEFYNVLFETQSPSQILLTLNRIMQETKISKRNFQIASNLLVKVMRKLNFPEKIGMGF